MATGGREYNVTRERPGARKGRGKIPRLILSIPTPSSASTPFHPRAEMSLGFCQVKKGSQVMTHSLFPTSPGCPRTCSVTILYGAAGGGLGHLCQECALPHIVLCLFRKCCCSQLCFFTTVLCKDTNPGLPCGPVVNRRHGFNPWSGN